MLKARRTAVVATMASLALGAAACGGGTGSKSSGGGGNAALVFGASADPKTLDPAYVNDGESFRPIRQIFEGLVTTKQGGTDVVPALAETWQPSPDGITWTFNLRKNVKFQDGTLFLSLIHISEPTRRTPISYAVFCLKKKKKKKKQK